MNLSQQARNVCWPNICTSLAQRRIRWAGVVQMLGLYKCFEFAGLVNYSGEPP